MDSEITENQKSKPENRQKFFKQISDSKKFTLNKTGKQTGSDDLNANNVNIRQNAQVHSDNKSANSEIGNNALGNSALGNSALRNSELQTNTGTSNIHILDIEFTAKDVQSILRNLIGNSEKIGLALLNYYARTNLVPPSGKSKSRGRKKYNYSDLILLCWLFQMKREGLPVNRFRRGIDYLRKKMPKLHKNPTDMILLTDGKHLFLKNRIQDKSDIAEALTGRKAGQYCWAYAIGSLIEEVDRIVDQHNYTKAAA